MRDICSILVATLFLVAGLSVSLAAGAVTVGASGAWDLNPGALFLAALSLFLAAAVAVSCVRTRAGTDRV